MDGTESAFYSFKFLQLDNRKGLTTSKMVLLTMTPAMVAAVKVYTAGGGSASNPDEPTLDEAIVGKPISHGQIIDIAEFLKNNSDTVQQGTKDGNPVSLSLADLLRGSSVYMPPPEPKPQPSAEYQALMADLRKREEARSYERMLNSSTSTETFSRRFPNAKYGHLFDSGTKSDDEDDITYKDVDRQLTLIINVLVTVIACSIAVWIVARRWDTPQRLALSMFSSIVLAIAEVVVYWGYINRLKNAKKTERKKVEKKKITETWIIESRKGESQPVNIISRPEHSSDESLRLRKTKGS